MRLVNVVAFEVVSHLPANRQLRYLEYTNNDLASIMNEVFILTCISRHAHTRNMRDEHWHACGTTSALANDAGRTSALQSSKDPFSVELHQIYANLLPYGSEVLSLVPV
jgi:hypothetical protein